MPHTPHRGRGDNASSREPALALLLRSCGAAVRLIGIAHPGERLRELQHVHRCCGLLEQLEDLVVEHGADLFAVGHVTFPVIVIESLTSPNPLASIHRWVAAERARVSAGSAS